MSWHLWAGPNGSVPFNFLGRNVSVRDGLCQLLSITSELPNSNSNLLWFNEFISQSIITFLLNAKHHASSSVALLQLISPELSHFACFNLNLVSLFPLFYLRLSQFLKAISTALRNWRNSAPHWSSLILHSNALTKLFSLPLFSYTFSYWDSNCSLPSQKKFFYPLIDCPLFSFFILPLLPDFLGVVSERFLKSFKIKYPSGYYYIISNYNTVINNK